MWLRRFFSCNLAQRLRQTTDAIKSTSKEFSENVARFCLLCIIKRFVSLLGLMMCSIRVFIGLKWVKTGILKALPVLTCSVKNMRQKLSNVLLRSLLASILFNCTAIQKSSCFDTWISFRSPDIAIHQKRDRRGRTQTELSILVFGFITVFAEKHLHYE